METIRRQIHPETRIVDRVRGIVDYIASDETLDSYREVIRASGWRFNQFKKNAPFVDSHDYQTIGNLLGKVIDFSVDARKSRLVNRVQWAVDVPGNQLAQLGWKMTEAGYLKAVSVGFLSVKALNGISSKREDWLQQLKELGLDEQNAPRVIYVEQEQIELSAVIIGANSNALLAAHKAGALTDRDVELFQTRGGSPIFQIPFDTKPTKTQTDMKSNLLATLEKLNGNKSAANRAPETIAPDSQGEKRNARRHPLIVQPGLRSACEQILSASPEKRAWLRAVFKLHGRASFSSFAPGELELAKSTISKALIQGTTPGSSLVSEDLSADIYALMLQYGAWKTLGVVPVDGFVFKLVTVSSKADGYWLKPASQGTAITADSSVTGTQVSEEILTLGTLVEVSNEALSDGGTTFEGAILQAIVEGLNYRLDWACFRADGTDDTTDGEMTGIFAHGNVPPAVAGAGNVSISKLQRDDFARCIGTVAASALQRPCRWWIAPAFLPELLKANDAAGYVLERPKRAGDEWMVEGFPVTWTAAAPATDGVSQQVAAFGRGDAYSIALRQQFEIARSASMNSKKFAENISLIRALTRARCEMRDATSFAILKTAAA